MAGQEQLNVSIATGGSGTRPALERSALLVTSVILALFFAEVTLRAAGFAQVTAYDRDPRWGYLMKPSQVVSSYGIPVEVNDQGLRGPSIQARKSDGSIRVLFVGDSVTHGGGWIREQDLFCRKIESLGAAQGLSIESINLGVPGWSPQNADAYLRSNGLLDSDWVVMVLPAIDLARPFSTMELHGLSERTPRLRLSGILLKLRAMLPRRGGHLEALESRVSANIEAVESIRDLAGERYFAVFVEYRPPHERSRHWPRFEDALPGFLDLRSTLVKDDYRDDVHLSSAGHQELALSIFRRLRQLTLEQQRAERGERL